MMMNNRCVGIRTRHNKNGASNYKNRAGTSAVKHNKQVQNHIKVSRWSKRNVGAGICKATSVQPEEPERTVTAKEIEAKIKDAEDKLLHLFQSGKAPPPASTVATIREKIAILKNAQKEYEQKEIAANKLAILKKLQHEHEILQKAMEVRQGLDGADLQSVEEVKRVAEAVENENEALKKILEIRQSESNARKEALMMEALKAENLAMKAKLQEVLEKGNTLKHLALKSNLSETSAEDENESIMSEYLHGEVEQVEPLQENEPEQTVDFVVESTADDLNMLQEKFEMPFETIENDSVDFDNKEETNAFNLVQNDFDVEESSHEIALEEVEYKSLANSSILMDEVLADLIDTYGEEKMIEREAREMKMAEASEANKDEIKAFNEDIESYMHQHQDDSHFCVPSTAIPGNQIYIFLNEEKITAPVNVESIQIKLEYNSKSQYIKPFDKRLNMKSGKWLMWLVDIPKYAFEMKFVFNGEDWSLRDNGNYFKHDCVNRHSASSCLVEMRKKQLKNFTRIKESNSVGGVGYNIHTLEDEVKKEISGIKEATMRIHAAAGLDDERHLFQVLQPSEPGQTVELLYNASEGPLSDCENLMLNWGFNAWSTKGYECHFEALSIKRSEKLKLSGKWFVTKIKVPENALVVDFVVSNNGRYDNNRGLDFHFQVHRHEGVDEYWKQFVDYLIMDRKAITEEKIEQEEKRRIQRRAIKEEHRKLALEKMSKQQNEIVWSEPASPIAGEVVTIHFDADVSNIKESDHVDMEVTFNRGSHSLKLPRASMLNSDGIFEISFPIPEDAFMIDVKFHGSDGTFDQNAGFGFHIPVQKASLSEMPLHAVHIAVEMAPVAKVGGLGDVVTSLGRAVQDMGNMVEIILPKYDTIDYDKIPGFRQLESFHWGGCENYVYTGVVEDLQVYFIEPGNGFFNIGMIYGADWEEIPMMDSERFGFFSKSALEFLLQSGRQPDIIHCHDWSTANVARSYWDDYHAFGLPCSSIVFTIHNFGYGEDLIAEAMSYCQKATTVSPTYASEISGEGAIQRGIDKFYGIRNGIDTDIWDAMEDPHLPLAYNSTNVMEGKERAKEALRNRVSLQRLDRPIVGIVSRLTLQKGVDLMEHAVWTALDRGCQVVLLGSAFDPKMQKHWEEVEVKMRHKYHDMARLIFAYDEPLSHLIYAASDMLLIPSTFEPCGLTQLISMRYGTVPIVRHTGGLHDTVFDVDFDRDRAKSKAIETNGYAFEGNDNAGMDYALHRAIDAWYSDKGFWSHLCATIMEQDWSWNEPAITYIDLYNAAMIR